MSIHTCMHMCVCNMYMCMCVCKLYMYTCMHIYVIYECIFEMYVCMYALCISDTHLIFGTIVQLYNTFTQHKRMVQSTMWPQFDGHTPKIYLCKNDTFIFVASHHDFGCQPHTYLYIYGKGIFQQNFRSLMPHFSE